MKNIILLVASVILLLMGCTTTRESVVMVDPAIRKNSNADDKLFWTVLLRIGEADHKRYPGAKFKKLARIDVITPYDNQRTGEERWFIDHGGGETAMYRATFTPDGRGGTDFAIQRDSIGKDK